MRKLKGARVWGWGDDPELAGKNAQTYVSKRWRSTTEECSIVIDGRNENILFGIVVYVSKPENIEDLVTNLFDIALTRGSKIYFITVNLYDHVASNKKTYRNSLTFVKEAYEKRERLLLQKFKEHPKVKPLLGKEKKLVITSATSIFCELESERFNKVIMWAGNCDLNSLIDYIHFLAEQLIERKIATRIIGYYLENNTEKLAIEDLYTRGKEVFLWLA
ncbi:MAG: hypothetical protein QXU11_09950 [Thermoproteota archaeon]